MEEATQAVGTIEWLHDRSEAEREREREFNLQLFCYLCVSPYYCVPQYKQSTPVVLPFALFVSVWQPLNADIQAAESNRKEECVSLKKMMSLKATKSGGVMPGVTSHSWKWGCFGSFSMLITEILNQLVL